MRGFGSGLIIGIILGAIGFWYFQKKAGEHPAAQARYEHAITNAGVAAGQAASNFSDAMRDKLDTLDLNTDEIKKELQHSGEIIRHKAHDIGDKMADAASDARAVTEIKAKFVKDPNLSAWKISVSCAHGHVMLTGTVSSAADIGRAIALAMDADGVRDVTSDLQVKPNS